MTQVSIPIEVRSVPDAVRHHRSLVPYAEVLREFGPDVAHRETRVPMEVIQRQVEEMIAAMGYVAEVRS